MIRAIKMDPTTLRARHVLRGVELIADEAGPRIAPVVLCKRELPDSWSAKAGTVLRGVIR
jgi:hypothetical protein